MGMPSMPELLILVAFFIVFIVVKKSIKKNNTPKDTVIDKNIQKILNESNNREIVINKLKKLLLKNGYKVSIEEEYLIQFKPTAIVGGDIINIDLEPYATSTIKTPRNNPLILPFTSIISMLSRIAKSDGIISEPEADVITDTITHLVTIAKEQGLSSSELVELRELLSDAHKKAKSSNIPISTYAQELSSHEMELKIGVIQQLIFMATIDGYTQLKESLIFEAGKTLGFNHSQIKRYIDDILGTKQESTKDSNPYDILKCKSTDDNATIKMKYRELVKKYHPDFIQSKDLDEAFVEFAKQKMQEINSAYDEIKRQRGI